MKTTITTVFALSILLFACNNSTTENSKVATETTTEEHHHDDENEAIVLNNGEKWVVDANMMVHIKDMQNDINLFAGKTTNDYSTLANKIKTNIDLLTSNCTMEGQAHDELHKWLVPFIDLYDEFIASKTEQEFVTNFENIKASFSTFNIYFK